MNPSADRDQLIQEAVTLSTVVINLSHVSAQGRLSSESRKAMHEYEAALLANARAIKALYPSED